jgi:cystathionine beta-lyase family protein involved in aluminum resistance
VIKEIIDLRKNVENDIENTLKKYKEVCFYNQEKVLNTFLKHNVSDFYFNPSTGYGYGDIGRDALEEIYAEIFGGEAALVRPQIVSGTHAISLCLFSNLKKDDQLVSIGRPYDTLQKVIGVSSSLPNSLTSLGVKYKEAPLEAIENNILNEYIDNNTKMVFIQRSRGYQERKTLTIKEIEKAIKQIKSISEEIIVCVDNCYGEFVEELEPCNVGADMVAGSLIKNPGGGLAPTGGYIIGKKNLIDLASDRLSAPGLGREVGSSTTDKRLFYQGIFMAPHIVLQSLETAIFASRLFEILGFKIDPYYTEDRGDIIQTITLQTRSNLLTFCETIQRNSPVDSQVKPEPAQLPGYDIPVIMAAGTFVQGASIELSVDAPVKDPYIAYLQGGLTSESSKIILLKAANELINKF